MYLADDAVTLESITTKIIAGAFHCRLSRSMPTERSIERFQRQTAEAKVSLCSANPFQM
jgi:hypothetical protein